MRVHFLQIWILPRERGIPPGYEQRAFPEAERRGRLRVVASPDGRDGSVTIHQDAAVLAGILSPGQRARHEMSGGRSAWVQVARGAVTVNGERLRAGDGLAATGEAALDLAGSGGADAVVLVFDLRA